jgi:hypothetical protein
MSKDILDELGNAYSFLRDPWIGKGIDEIARLRRLLEGRWQPIETAPNEVWCLVYTPHQAGSGNQIFVGKRGLVFDGREEWIVFRDDKFPGASGVPGETGRMHYTVVATHWMPLPEPPNA